jgi:glycerate 2-kinase
LGKYQLLDAAPDSIVQTLQKGCRGEIAETQKALENTHNYIIGEVKMALEAMFEKARQLGFKPLIISAEQRGDTAEVAALRAKEILSGVYSGYNALLSGGETTPTLPARHGRGGRNQHYAACTIAELKGFPGEWVLASVGTDGSDFVPDIAGAIVDNRTAEFFVASETEIQKSIEYYDSYGLLKKTGNSLMVTGNTHTNVGDIILYLFKQDINQ